ncbi:MAG: hypothetical protein P4L71_06145 [Acetobacteraceae bacterium]|nr:hypothetical protein [Acetobacteraceae bacterium]
MTIIGIRSRARSAECASGGAVIVALFNVLEGVMDIGAGCGARVNAHQSGPVEADRFAQNVVRLQDHMIAWDEVVAFLRRSERTTRVGRPEGISAGGLPCLSEGQHILGAVIDTDGGATRFL